MARILDDINIGVRDDYLPSLVDQLYTRIALLGRMINRRRFKWGQGKSIKQRMIIGDFPVYDHNGQYEEVKVAPVDATVEGTFNLARIYTTMSLTEADEDLLTGPEAVGDLIKDKLEIARRSLKKQIEKRLFVQTATAIGNPLNSLQMIVDDGDTYGTYGGLSRTDYPELKAKVDDGGGANRTLSRTLMINLYNQLTDDENDNSPTIIITTPELWTAVEGMIAPAYRFSDPDLAKMGHPNILFMNTVPVIKSYNVPANTMLMLNEEYFHMILHKKCDKQGFEFKPFEKLQLRTIKAAEIWFKGQIICSRCSAQGVLKNITP